MQCELKFAIRISMAHYRIHKNNQLIIVIKPNIVLIALLLILRYHSDNRKY